MLDRFEGCYTSLIWSTTKIDGTSSPTDAYLCRAWLAIVSAASTCFYSWNLKIWEQIAMFFLGNYGCNRMCTICLCEIANTSTQSVPQFSKSTNYVSHDSCCTWFTPYYKLKIQKSMSLTPTPDELLPRPKARRPPEKEQKQTKPFHSSHC
jgi:hypothetical protein